MTLKAILFDFNGVIINDENIRQKLVDEILLGENLLPSDTKYKNLCLGKSDQICLKNLLSLRGRVVSDEYLTKLIDKKIQLYFEAINNLDSLPIYPDITEFLLKIKEYSLLTGLVTDKRLAEVQFILNKANLNDAFSIIVTGDDLKESKSDLNPYILALNLLNKENPDLLIQSSECLVIEDTLSGIMMAKNAGMKILGVANTYPLHLLQRHTNWVVDNLLQLELKRVKKILAMV